MAIPQLRIDPVVGRKVLIAEDRAGRPNDHSSAALSVASNPPDEASVDRCPFCVGNEHLTPRSSVEIPDDHGGWRVRVVANKFPAVVCDSTARTQSDFEKSHFESVFPDPRQALGAHEVIIESPRHVRDFLDLSINETATVLQVYRDRLRHWAADSRLRHALIFKNVGFAAGASLEHVHGQLVALPYVPAAVAEEINGARRYYDSQDKCVFCQLLREELQCRERLVAEEGPFVAFCAYAGRQPYETWVMPTAHAPRFELLSDEDALSLARIFHQVLGRLSRQLSPLAYNLFLHTSPFPSGCEDYYHWHWELVPRTCQLAGLEWGAGVFINPVSPERAASFLQKVKI